MAQMPSKPELLEPLSCVEESAVVSVQRVRGHTLVWHQQVPRWVFVGDKGPATRAIVLDQMQEHISTLLTRYKGQVYCWDVVNEALSDDGGWRTDSPWFAAAGADEDGDGIPDYIEKAFEFARQADPSALLFYNDYNIKSGAKLEAAVRLVKALKEKGLVDGVGIQGHWLPSLNLMHRPCGMPSSASSPWASTSRSRSWVLFRVPGGEIPLPWPRCLRDWKAGRQRSTTLFSKSFATNQEHLGPPGRVRRES